MQIMLCFSAHGVPLAYVEEAGDPYKAEMEECVDLIMEELEKRGMANPSTLAYQVNTSHADAPCILRKQPHYSLAFAITIQMGSLCSVQH